MSFTSLGPLFSPAPLGSGGVFGGVTGFGFNIPQGDPGAIESAGNSAAQLGRAFGEQAQALSVAARVAFDAAGGWRGEASGAYSAYSGELMGALHGNAGACEQAAGALRSLGQALSHAQSVTKQALADCEKFQRELTTQQGIEQTEGQNAQTALANAANAQHPPAADAFVKEATAAQARQSAAHTAAVNAANDLTAAKRRGLEAWEGYTRTAQGLAARIGAAARELRSAPQPAGGAPAPIAPSASEVTLAAQVIATVGAGKASAPLINAVPANERTPGFVFALIQQQQEKFDESLAGGGARAPYSMWTSGQFGNSAPTVNAAVTAGVLPPMPSNWSSMSDPARQSYWRSTSSFFSGVSCVDGGCSVVNVVGTGTASASQVISNIAKTSEWTAIGFCVFGSDGACIGATKFALGADTASNVVHATSLPNLLAREGVTTAELAVGGPGLVKAALGSAGKLEGLLPKSLLGRFALNGVLTGPSAGVTAVAPSLDHRLFPEPAPAAPPQPPHHHHHG